MTQTLRDPNLPPGGLTADDLCLSVGEGVYGEIRDASKTTRAAATSFFAGEVGCSFTDVRCRVRYARLFTLQETWDGPGKDRWVDVQDWEHYNAFGVHLPLGPLFEKAPKEPPADFEPDETMACWQFCERTTPGAIKIYVCEEK